MQLEEFQSGTYRKQFQYRSFTPTLVNGPWEWSDSRLNSLLSEANRWVGELNVFSQLLPDVDTYIKMHVLKEANASSRIEGTRTNIETAALPEEEVDPEGRDDWREVHNYVAAMNHAVERLTDLPLSNRLLREAHGILLQGVRGEHKTPDEFRTSQNWIGGSSLADAVFIPPHPEEVPELMADLETFWHNESIHVPHLIRVAISHYQFETIHPFLDGNGRIGRLLITLYLMNHGLLAKPCLYVSDFLERNRASYYDALTAVRTRHDLLHWVHFFLSAINETGRKAVETFRAIVRLKAELEAKTAAMGRRSHNASRFLALLYGRPTVRVQHVIEGLQVSSVTAHALIKDFQKQEILQNITGYRRNRIFLFRPYFDLFRQ